MKCIHMYDMLCILIDIMSTENKYKVKVKVCRLNLFCFLNKLIKPIYQLENS